MVGVSKRSHLWQGGFLESGEVSDIANVVTDVRNRGVRYISNIGIRYSQSTMLSMPVSDECVFDNFFPLVFCLSPVQDEAQQRPRGLCEEGHVIFGQEGVRRGI